MVEQDQERQTFLRQLLGIFKGDLSDYRYALLLYPFVQLIKVGQRT